MQLVFKRDQEQRKGLFGDNKGTRFRLNITVRMTDGEKSLTSQYKVWNYRLYIPSEQSSQAAVSVRDANGTAIITTNDALELLAIEESIRAACESFNAVLNVVASFGGETVIEIGADQTDKNGSP